MSSSSKAELKLQAKMVEGRRKERKNTSWIKHPILILPLLFCCYLLLVNPLYINSGLKFKNLTNGHVLVLTLDCCTILVPVQPCSDYWF